MHSYAFPPRADLQAATMRWQSTWIFSVCVVKDKIIRRIRSRCFHRLFKKTICRFNWGHRRATWNLSPGSSQWYCSEGRFLFVIKPLPAVMQPGRSFSDSCWRRGSTFLSEPSSNSLHDPPILWLWTQVKAKTEGLRDTDNTRPLGSWHHEGETGALITWWRFCSETLHSTPHVLLLTVYDWDFLPTFIGISLYSWYKDLNKWINK